MMGKGVVKTKFNQMLCAVTEPYLSFIPLLEN